MIVYIMIYIVIGLIAGIIDDESEKKKNLSFTLMIIGAIISFLTNGIFVIAAIIEMAIGYLIIVKIKSFFNKNKKNSNIKYNLNKNSSKLSEANDALDRALKRLREEEKKRLVDWAIQFNISEIVYNQENIENIEKLDISNKNIKFLPSEIFSLKNLKILKCNNNNITKLPIFISRDNNLMELELLNNKLEFLPPEIGSMKNLSILLLSGNDLKSLPESIINLKSLKKLQLVDNKLLKISENQQLWMQDLIYNKIDVEIDTQLLIKRNDKDINVRNILKKAIDDSKLNQSILTESDIKEIKEEKAKIIQNPPPKKRGLRIVEKVSSNKTLKNDIVEFLDNELVELKKELKILENKLQILSEQKTEYLNDIEEFNTLYNLHLGELIKSILNLKKEILYKQTIKQQKEKARYEDAELEIADLKFEISYIESQMEELLEKWQNIQPDDKNYDEIFATYKELQDELEKLENELEEQEENLSKTKEEIEKDEVFEEYEERKKQYEQFHQNYEDIKQQQSNIFDITNEQKSELKKLWKKACKLCHPDIVIDKFKEKAHEIMQSLNDAYSKKDIVKVKEILSNLENGLTFEIESDNINDKEILKSKINQYKENISHLEEEIEDIKHDETYQTISELDDWDEYFESLKTNLEEEKKRLEKEASEVLKDNDNKTQNKEIKSPIKNNLLSVKFGGLLIDIKNIDKVIQIKNKLYLQTYYSGRLEFDVYDSESEAKEDMYIYNGIIKNPDCAVVLIRDNGYLSGYPKDSDEYRELQLGFNIQTEHNESEPNDEEIEEWIKIIWEWADEYNISNNKIARNVEKLVNTTILDLTNIKINYLPNEISNLDNLKELILWDCGIKYLPLEIIKLTNLKKLNLRGNKELAISPSQKEWIETIKTKNTVFMEEVRIVRDETVAMFSGKAFTKQNEEKETNSTLKPEISKYSKYIQSIENPNFEKVRRYCNNLLDDNQADEMQKYLAEQGRMYKAIIYDALEQFIEKLDDETITLVDWGCEQGIGSILVLDYIKEKQLDIIVNQIILLDDNITAISRAMSQIEALKQNDIELLVIQNDTQLEALKNIKNDVTLNISINDKMPINILDLDYDLLKNAYFMCLSNENENFINIIYGSMNFFKNIEDISIRDNKIGRFDRYERIFKI